jgi:DDE superfamily endonuclease
MKFSQLDYCQYLLSSQINYTITNLAEHIKKISHDQINRYLRTEKLSPRLLWENVKSLIQSHHQGYIIFDDTVLDKRSSQDIELSRKQYSGNEHRVVKGIGLVNCVYVNPVSGKFWVIDYRLYDPDGDGKSKLDHVLEMLQNLIYYKLLPFRTVLMDSWYATKNLMQYIDKQGKIYYCPSSLAMLLA